MTSSGIIKHTEYTSRCVAERSSNVQGFAVCSVVGGRQQGWGVWCWERGRAWFISWFPGGTEADAIMVLADALGKSSSDFDCENRQWKSNCFPGRFRGSTDSISTGRDLAGRSQNDMLHDENRSEPRAGCRRGRANGIPTLTLCRWSQMTRAISIYLSIYLITYISNLTDHRVSEVWIIGEFLHFFTQAKTNRQIDLMKTRKLPIKTDLKAECLIWDHQTVPGICASKNLLYQIL